MIEVINVLMKENEQHPSFMLVDGMALLFRAFYATAVTGQFMINSKGIPTNAVQGFLKHMLTAVNHFSPSHVAVCWDMEAKLSAMNYLMDTRLIVQKHQLK